MGKNRIRDKHPGSATLDKNMVKLVENHKISYNLDPQTPHYGSGSRRPIYYGSSESECTTQHWVGIRIDPDPGRHKIVPQKRKKLRKFMQSSLSEFPGT
jgi:hypothetical protein